MAALESAVTVFAPQRIPNNNYRFLAKAPDTVKLHASPSLSSNHNPLFSSNNASSKTRRLCFQLCSALQEAAEAATAEEKTEQSQPINNVKKKLYVYNLPWSLSAPDIKDLFAQCGTVTDVEVVLNLIFQFWI